MRGVPKACAFCASVTVQPTLPAQTPSERPAVRLAAPHMHAEGSIHAKDSTC